MITCNNHEHGLVYASSTITVDIDNRERFFTVYDMNEKPVATIIRPRMYSKDRWEVSNTDGTIIGRAYGARHAFCIISIWYNKKLAAQS